MAVNSKKREIHVYADWVELNEPKCMGILSSELLRGKEIFSFTYNDNWLQSGNAQLLDPDLQLYSGLQYLNDQNKSNFGMFLDSSPDRWGRVLMMRREAALSKQENRAKKQLFETDYLLGVFDGHRMGAIRFKETSEGPFLSENKELSSPPWTSIRELEQISLKLEEDDVIDNPDYIKWLNILVAPGSSLGGARPKASIVDKDNALWIAKFPSKNDNSDIGAWEMVVYELAVSAGIKMAECTVQKFSSDYHTFLTKRFDRTHDGRRIHFASAMTLLGYTDGSDHTEGVSYLELVDFITSHGSNVNEDLEQLWRRIVFSICVSNVDDHLRNHGFILTNQGWTLSPAYDINPVESGVGLKLNISDTDNSLDLELALEVKDYFRLTEEKAQKIIDEIKSSVKNWQTAATKYGISRVNQELKSMAFSKAEIV